ncbi:MAG: DUF4870 domain-containing protein [Pseudomonadota bacterium]
MTTNTQLDGLSKDERTWGMLSHLSALAGFIIPFGSVIGPLVVWLMKREEMPFVADQGKEALNFQITMLLASLAALVLVLILVGILLLFALMIFNLVITIVAAVRANDGVRYRYPFALRLVS